MEPNKELTTEPVVTDYCGPSPVGDYLSEYLGELGDGTRRYLGLETGIHPLDEAMSGISGLIVLGGQSGCGKTTLALNVAYETAKKGTPVIIYSLEMSKLNLLTKIFNKLTKISYRGILLGKKKIEQEYINRFKTDVGSTLYIMSSGTGDEKISLTKLESDIEYVKVKHKAKEVLVIVDHLQIFPLDVTKKDENYRDQIDKEQKLIIGFREIKERTGACIVLISQLSKAKYDSRGSMSIKGSVGIVYQAEIVMILIRPFWEAGNKSDPSFTLIVDKNRYGPNPVFKGSIFGDESNVVFDGNNIYMEPTEAVLNFDPS